MDQLFQSMSTLIRPFRVITDEGNYNDNFNIKVNMVDHAEYIIGVFDNQKKLRSGTEQTVNYALRNGKAITLMMYSA